MKRSASFVLLFIILSLSAAPGLRAAIEKDLGQALAYFRVTDAHADQAAAVDTIEHRPALVLDLRSVIGDAHLIAALHGALAKTPAPHAARFILVNATTSFALITALDDDALLSVVTLSPNTPGLNVDIAVTTSEVEDFRALAALAGGTPLEKLITDTRDKRRYDEAKLVHDHANGITPADADLPADAEDDSITPEPPKEKPASGTGKKPSPPSHDLVLERAVQLHRSLLALKKL